MSERTRIPSIIKEGARGTSELTLSAKLLEQRKIYLFDDIDRDTAQAFMMEISYLEGISNEPISLYINSGGGEITSGLMMIDIMDSMKAPLDIWCTGIAASMAAMILACGKKGHRFILPHSKTMIHEPLIGSGLGGSATSIKNISDSIMHTKELVNGLLAERTGKTVGEIDEATSFDHYFDAKESVEFGLCDEVRMIR